MSENTEEVVLSPIEQKAVAQGWKPKEQWEGDPADWREAKEFVERGELFGKIRDLKAELHTRDQRHIEELRGVNDAIGHIRKTALEDAKRELLAQIRASDDKEEIVRLSGEVAKVSEDLVKLDEKKAGQPKPTGNRVPPEVELWQEANRWYTKDEEMTMDADAAAAVFLGRNPTATPAAVLAHVDKKIRSLYPEKFGVQKAIVPPSPEEGEKKTPASTKGRKTRADLPEQYRRVMDVMVKRKVMTETEYLDSYFKNLNKE